MKRRAWLLLIAAVCLSAAPARAQTTTLASFTGFDYLVPAGPLSGANPGDQYASVGFITSSNPLLLSVYNPVANEYTYYLNATVSAAFYDAFAGVVEIAFNPGGTIGIHEDSRTTGTAASYGINPPNATAPPTFVDGTLGLSAQVDNLVLIYDYSSNQGNFEGQANLVGGAWLALVPVAQRNGWVLGGLAGAPNASVPQGYINQVNGELVLPTATNANQKSWGSIKALYR
jgi:hypothetical protein